MNQAAINPLSKRNPNREATWQFRALAATCPPDENDIPQISQLGCILLAAIGSGRNTLPRFGRQATITADGTVIAPFLTRRGEIHAHAVVCTISDLIRNFRGLADHLKLTDQERTELFTAVRKWCATDYRPGASGELFGK